MFAGHSRKRARTEADGAEVIIVGPDSDERAQRAEELAEQRGLVPVPPFDDPRIAAGQGTAALELIEDAGAIDSFYAPISGGGLMSGCAVVVSALAPDAEIWIFARPGEEGVLDWVDETGRPVTALRRLV